MPSDINQASFKNMEDMAWGRDDIMLELMETLICIVDRVVQI